MARARLLLAVAACGAALTLLALRDTLARGERSTFLEGAAERTTRAEEPFSGPAQLELSAPAPDVLPAATAAERRAVDASLPTAVVGAEVLGTVVDASGAPLSGAEVSLFDAALYGSERPADLFAPQPVRRLRTGADGRFTFPVAEADRRYGVQVHAETFVPKGRNQSPGVDVPFELTAAGALTGRVRGTDAALAQVLYQGAVWADGVMAEGQFQASDGSGGYAAPGLPVGRVCMLEVKPAGGPSFRVEVPVEEPGEQRYDIELGERSWVEVHVTHAFTGAPVADAVASMPWRGATLELARSDKDGRLRLSLQGGIESASSPAERPAAWRPVMIHAPGMLATLDATLGRKGTALEQVRLIPSGRLQGRVLSSSGAPVAGAEVRWAAPFVVMDRGVDSLQNGPGSLFSVTDPEGRFALADVLWGQPDAVVEVWIGGELRRVVFGAAPDAPGTTRNVEVRLFDSPAIAGRVRVPRRLHAWWSSASARSGQDRRGELPPGVIVRARPASGGDELEAHADAAGVFLLTGLKRGEYAVRASDARGSESREVLVHVPRPEAEGLELVLFAPQRTLAGRILNADGTPWARGEVTLHESVEGGEFITVGAKTDADGFFSAELRASSSAGLGLAFVTLDLGRSAVENLTTVGGDLLWTLPDLVPVRVRVLGLEAAPGPSQFRWRRRDHGDGSCSSRARPGAIAPTGMTGMGYASSGLAPVAQAAAEGVEVDLPLGTFELLLYLDENAGPVLERTVTLPADAPGGVLTLAL